MNGALFINVNLEDNLQDTEKFWSKLRLDLAELKKTDLPDGVLGPMVDYDFGDTVAVLLAIHGDHYGYRELKDYAERIESSIRRIRAVSKVKRIGEWQKRQGLIKGAKWYMLTADYAFGHDLAKVSTRFLQENGGIVVQNDLVPTNTPDYSPYILKIRQANPDFVYLNLAGVDQTTFLKQFKEFGLPYKLAGGVMDTIPFWAAGIDALSGYWQSLWYHGLTSKGAEAFTKAFTAKYGGPPDNQAWGDYMA
jgi:hypothetical protein